MTQRQIDQTFIKEQKSLQPFQWIANPKTDHYTDGDGLVWATVAEFPSYEISNTKIVREKISKKQLQPYAPENRVHFATKIEGNPTKYTSRSVNLVYMKTFNTPEQFVALENEMWCKLAEFPDIIVSNAGRVMNLETLSLLEGTDDKGALEVKIKNKEGNYQKRKVHQLVAFAFLGPPPEGLTAYHKNRIKTDNSLRNLEYLDCKDKQLQARNTGEKFSAQMPVQNVQIVENETWLIVPSALLSGVLFHDYRVSNFGRIASGTRLLQRNLAADGYMRVLFQINGVRWQLMQHVVVATAFVPNPQNLPQVDHLDGNTVNNRADNLEWVTGRENTERAIAKSVTKYDPETKETQLYRSAVRAAEENPEHTVPAITRACRQERDHYKGLYWWYTDEVVDVQNHIQELDRLRNLDNAAAYARPVVIEDENNVELKNLHECCNLHKFNRGLCFEESEFEIKIADAALGALENGVKWIRLLEFPGYEISSLKTVRKFTTKDQIASSDGRVRLYHEQKEHHLSVQALHHQYFFQSPANLVSEKWKHLVPQLGYCVSNRGRLFNCKDLTMLSPKISVNFGTKYNDVRLKYLVAQAFLPKLPDDSDVLIAIDGDDSNCKIENLRWVKKTERKRKLNPEAKTTAKKILQIDPVSNAVVVEHKSNRAAAESCGVTAMVICNATRTGKIWRGFLWKIKPSEVMSEAASSLS